MSTADPTTPATTPHAHRSKGELVFDVALVVGIGCYLLVARSYPPIGREIPTVVGLVALAAAVVQLIGWFVPGLWKLTHGVAGDETSGPRAATTPTGNTPPAEGAPSAPAPPEGRTTEVAIAMGWAAGFAGGIVLVGYVVAVPLFFLAYFGARRCWRLALVSAVVMGLVTRFLFESLLGIPLPAGVLF